MWNNCKYFCSRGFIQPYMKYLDVWTPVFSQTKKSVQSNLWTGDSQLLDCSWSIIPWLYCSVLRSAPQAEAPCLCCYPSSIGSRRALWLCLHSRQNIGDSCLPLQLLQNEMAPCVTPWLPTDTHQISQAWSHQGSPDTSHGGEGSREGPPQGQRGDETQGCSRML